MDNRRYPRYHLPAASCLPVVLEIGETGQEISLFGMLINISLSGLCLRSRNLVTENMPKGTGCFIEVEYKGSKLQTFGTLVRSEHVNTQSLIALEYEPVPATVAAFDTLRPGLFELGGGTVVPIPDTGSQGLRLRIEGVFYHATINEFLYYLASDRILSVDLTHCTQVTPEGVDVLRLCTGRGIPVRGMRDALLGTPPAPVSPGVPVVSPAPPALGAPPAPVAKTALP